MRTLLIEAAHPPSHQLERVLRDRGHEVVRCEEGGAALAAAASGPFDLVIADLGTPGLDFPATSRALRSAPGGDWCGILVVGDRRGDVEEAVRSGADDYLVRTEDPELLRVRLTVAERRVEDSAARRRMMSALTASEGRFRELLETAPDAIFRVGTDGRIQLVNGHAERMSGYSREELVGQPVELLVPEPLRAAHVGQRRAFAATPVTRPMGARSNLLLRRKDGSHLPIDICLGHYRADGQEYTIAAVRDVTERRRLEDELRLAKEAAEHAYERIRRDMEAAARLQRALLPATLPEVPGVRFAWQYHPCAGLAGDGLNIFLLDDDHVGLYLLDVSGHGVGAALLSVSLARLLSPTPGQSSFLRVPRTDGPGYTITPPAEVARQLNEWFLANPAGEQYFTIVYAVLEVRTRCLRYVSAGHPGLVHARGGASPEHLSVPGFPVGCFAEAEYEDRVLHLRPGDRLFLYSDGVPDALSPAGEHFGQERLMRAVAAGAGDSLDACTRGVLRQVLQWAGDEPQDDLSVLAIAVE